MAQPAPQPRQSRQRLQERVVSAILDAAAAVLVERGGAASMADVAAAAGVARATVYRYFPTRDALVARLVERGQRSGALRHDIPAAWLAEALVGLAASIVSSTASLGKEDTVSAVAALFLEGARHDRAADSVAALEAS